jgi:hypothetical protein
LFDGFGFERLFRLLGCKIVWFVWSLFLKIVSCGWSYRAGALGRWGALAGAALGRRALRVAGASSSGVRP